MRQIGSLSGGERSRLLLAREFARAANLLVLDEPTNDLDLETLDLLQEVIADYDGTVLIVSHDRDFLDRTVTITLGLDGSGRSTSSRAAMRIGQASAMNSSGRAFSDQGREDSATASPPAGTQAKLTYKDQRDYDRLPGEIERLKPKSSRTKRCFPIPDSTCAIRTASRS